MCHLQMEFHQIIQHLIVVIRPYLESPWSVVFKSTFTFKFIIYSGEEMGCQRYFMIMPRCAKTPQIKKRSNF